MSNNKQSSVEWLIEQFQLHGYLGLYTEEEHIEKHKTIFEGIVYKAKAMEKQQIIDSFGGGCQVESTRLIAYHGIAEQYYNETFNKNEI